MTMAAGFKAADGFILCADTQISQSFVKYPQSKFRTFYGLDVQPAFVFASDDVVFTDMIIQRLVDHIAISGLGIKLLRSMEQEVRSIYKEFPKESKMHDLLLVARLKGPGDAPKLFRITGHTISPVLRYSCVGTGQIITQGLVTELYDHRLDLGRMALVAAYALAEAKKYGGFVGGNSEILLAWNSRPYELFPVDHLFKDIEDLDKTYFTLKLLFQHVTLSYGDSRISKEEFASDWKRLSDTVLERRAGDMRDLAEREQLRADMNRREELLP